MAFIVLCSCWLLDFNLVALHVLFRCIIIFFIVVYSHARIPLATDSCSNKDSSRQFSVVIDVYRKTTSSVIVVDITACNQLTKSLARS